MRAYAGRPNGDAAKGVTNEPLKQGNAVVVYKNSRVDIVNQTGSPRPDPQPPTRYRVSDDVTSSPLAGAPPGQSRFLSDSQHEHEEG